MPNALFRLCLAGLLAFTSGCVRIETLRVARDEVGGTTRITAYAHQTGPGYRMDEESPGGVSSDAVLDEATLSSVGPDLCVELLVRTEVDFDVPASRWNVELNGERARLLEERAPGIVDHSYTGTVNVVSAYGALGRAVGALSIDRPAEKLFRVVWRGGRFCTRPADVLGDVTVVVKAQNAGLTSWDVGFRWER